MFNTFFCEQFSYKSEYEINRDWTNDEHFDINFCREHFQKLLGNIYSDKACGPDGIHAKILKKCASC